MRARSNWQYFFCSRCSRMSFLEKTLAYIFLAEGFLKSRFPSCLRTTFFLDFIQNDNFSNSLRQTYETSCTIDSFCHSKSTPLHIFNGHIHPCGFYAIKEFIVNPGLHVNKPKMKHGKQTFGGKWIMILYSDALCKHLTISFIYIAKIYPKP